MTFDLSLRVIGFKEWGGGRWRLRAELIPAEADAKGQLAYFNRAATFTAKLDGAGLEPSLSTEISAAVTEAYRTPGAWMRVEKIPLGSAQVSALGFRTLALRMKAAA